MPDTLRGVTMMNNRKGYKAFKKGLICAPDKNHVKQYAENTVYEEDGGKICEPGMMHYCLNPLDCLEYYPLIDENGDMTEFCEVEALDEPVTDDNEKFATKKLKIGAKLDFAGVVKAAVEVIKEETTSFSGGSGDCAQIGSSGDSAKIGSSGRSAQIGSSGDSAKIGSSGDYAQIGSSGDSAKIGSSGRSAQIGSSGNCAQIGSSGRSAQIGSSGNCAQIGSSGDSAKIGSSGNCAQIGSSGDSAKIGSSGDYAKINLTGVHCVAAAVGMGSMIKASKGCWITLAEWAWDKRDERFVPACVKSAIIDGETLKPDTWYKLRDGEFVEADER